MSKNLYCAPAYTGGSTCFTEEALHNFVTAWNTRVKKKGGSRTNLIDLSQSHKKILDQVRGKFQKYCTSDHCLLSLDFLNDLPIKQYRKIQDCFRPEHPVSWLKDKTEWLSTTDIDDVLEQYDEARPDFKYFGAVPLDFDKKLSSNSCVSDELCTLDLKKLYKKGITKLGVVFNLDPHDKPGSHWMCMFVNINTGASYYYDSYGVPPEKECLDLMQRIQKQGNEMLLDGTLDFDDIDNQHTKYLQIQDIKGSKKILIKDKGNIGKNQVIFVRQKTKRSKQPYSIKKAVKRKDGRKIVKLNASVCNELKQCCGNPSRLQDWDIVCKGFHCFFNNVRYQRKESECGTYGIYFIVQMLEGKTFYDLIHERITDDKMNDLRYSLYWRKPITTIQTSVD